MSEQSIPQAIEVPGGPKRSSFKKYNSLDGANAGQRLILKDAAGNDTEDWIHVLGMDSDTFQRASKAMRRSLMAYLDKNNGAKPSDEAYIDLSVQEQRKLQTALVQSWSFDEPCTPKLVLELFTCAPFIGEQVDSFASKRERFVKS